MSAHKVFDLDTLAEAATDRVRLWLTDEEDGAAGSSPLQRSLRDEACRVAWDAEDLAGAAAALRSWFSDRLTILPETLGPVANLASHLMGTSLVLIDWETLADEIRE